MQFKFLIIVLAIFISNLHYAQVQTYNSKSTSISDNSRYEFIQSELAAKFAFKVDKYTGNIYQLVLAEDESLIWQLIPKENSTNDKMNQNKINYQLYISGLAARYTFLLNVNTGLTWQLSEDNEQGILYWGLINEK